MYISRHLYVSIHIHICISSSGYKNNSIYKSLLWCLKYLRLSKILVLRMPIIIIICLQSRILRSIRALRVQIYTFKKGTVLFDLVPKAAKNREALNAQNTNNTLYKQFIVDIMSNKCLPIPYRFRQ
jgi:hypothetical protein